MATAKKAASAASKTSDKTTSGDAPEARTTAQTTGDGDNGAGEPRPQVAPAGSGDSGPGTGTDAPEDETPRTPDGTVINPGGGAAPLAAEDVAGQTEPALGHDESSTDHVYAVTGGQSIAGETVQRLVDEDGNTLTADDIFEDDDTSKTFLVVKQKVIEVFRYPNTTEDATRVLYNKGRPVPRDLAQRVLATIKAHA